MQATPSKSRHNFDRVLAFVEGSMEQQFIKNNMKKIRVIKIEGGNSRSAEKLCEQIESKYTTANIKARMIIIWIDKEKMIDRDERFIDLLKNMFASKGISKRRISICIPNQMTENIILSDEQLIIKEFFDEEQFCYEYTHEGKNGAHVLNSLFKMHKNSTYKKTTDGVRLLKKVCLERASEKSISARQFKNSLPRVNFWWIIPQRFDFRESTDE
jgi:hypothetical protein